MLKIIQSLVTHIDFSAPNLHEVTSFYRTRTRHTASKEYKGMCVCPYLPGTSEVFLLQPGTVSSSCDATNLGAKPAAQSDPTLPMLTPRFEGVRISRSAPFTFAV